MQCSDYAIWADAVNSWIVTTHLLAEAMPQLKQVGHWCGDPGNLLPHSDHTQLSHFSLDLAGKDNSVVLWFSCSKPFTALKRRQSWVLISLYLFASFSNSDKGTEEEKKFLKAILKNQLPDVLSQYLESSATIKKDVIKSWKIWECVHFMLLSWKGQLINVTLWI